MASEKKYKTISIPIGISDAVDELIEELGYWPSRGAFIREATLDKIRKERKLLKELREAEEPDPARNRGRPEGENGLKKEIEKIEESKNA